MACLVERQELAVILEQHHAFASRVEGDRLIGNAVGGERWIPLFMIEPAEAAGGVENALDLLVDDFAA